MCLQQVYLIVSLVCCVGISAEEQWETTTLAAGVEWLQHPHSVPVGIVLHYKCAHSKCGNRDVPYSFYKVYSLLEHLLDAEKVSNCILTNIFVKKTSDEKNCQEAHCFLLIHQIAPQ